MDAQWELAQLNRRRDARAHYGRFVRFSDGRSAWWSFNGPAVFAYLLTASFLLAIVLVAFTALPAAKSLHRDSYSVPGNGTPSGTVWHDKDAANGLYGAAVQTCPTRPSVTLSPLSNGDYTATVRCGK